MTVTAQYLDDLSRVRLTLTDIPDGTVRVERSLDQVNWVTVRGGSSLPVQNGLGVLDDYEFSPDELNYYRVIMVDPPPGLSLPGEPGSYASTPDVPELTIPNNIDVRVEATIDNWADGTDDILVGQFMDGGDQRSWMFVLLADGSLRFFWSEDGVSATSVTSQFPVTDIISTGRLAVRVTMVNNLGDNTHTITFYTAESIQGPWVQFGAPITSSGAVALFDSAAPLEVGARNGGTTAPLTGIIHAVQVRNGVEGVDITGLQLPGDVGDYASTPDDPVLDVTGRIDLRMEMEPVDWTPSASQGLARKYSITGDQRSWAWWLTSSGNLAFRVSANGVAFSTATSTVPVPVGTPAVRVTYVPTNGSNSVWRFFTGDSVEGPWEQLGSPLGSTPTSGLFANTAPVEVGRITDGVDGITSDSFDGLIHEFTMRDGIEEFPRQGLLLDGVSGNYASTPDAAQLDITGDLEIAAFIEPAAWSGSSQSLVTKFDTATNQRAYQLILTTGGNLQLIWSVDGTATSSAVSTVVVSTPSDEVGVAVRATLDVDDGGGNRVVTFYTADSVNGPWTQLGSQVVTAGITSIFASTAPLEIGSRGAGTTNLLTGLVRSAIVRNGIGGTIVAAPIFEDQPAGTTVFEDAAGLTWTVNGTAEIIDDPATIVADPDFDAQPAGVPSFDDTAGRTWTVNGNAQIIDVTGGTIVANPDFESQPAGTTMFVDDVGRVWTIHGDAFIISNPVGEISIFPMVGVPWLKSVEFPFLNRPLDCIDYRDIEREGRSGAFAVKGRSLRVGVTDLHLSREFDLQVATKGPDATDRLEMLLVGGGTLFLSVPPEFDLGCNKLLQIPSGYFIVEDVTFRRLVRASRVTQWEFPLIQVAPPHLESITPTTMIWSTVLDLYDSWQELIDAHPTWRSLLQQVSSPEVVDVP